MPLPKPLCLWLRGLSLPFTPSPLLSGAGAEPATATAGAAPLKASSPPASLIVALALISAACLCITACRSFSPATQAKISATAAYAGQKTLAVGDAAFWAATETVISQAVSPADRQTKVDYTQGLATGLRTAEGQLLTQDDVSNLVAIWTPAKPHWTALGSQLATLYTQANPQTPAEAKAVLESLAEGLEQAK